MHPTPGVSIIVNNYNSSEFLRAAIDSALGQDHPSVEVIVVDDCSSDGSAEIMASYGSEIRTLVRSKNGGQVAAINQALPLATGDIVIFLDGDDLLMPDAASTVAATWRPGVTKVQYCLATIDDAGEDLGYVWPDYPACLDTATIQRQLLREGSYPSVSACGNAYARSFLVQRGLRSELRWMDQMLEVDAPFAGEVLTIRRPLASYRYHGQSDSMTTSVSRDRFKKLFANYVTKLDYLDLRCRELGIPLDLAAVKANSLWHAELSLVLRKLGADGPGRVFPMLAHALGVLIRSSQPARKKCFLALWQLALALAPERHVGPILTYRFLPQSRPRFMRARAATLQAAVI